MKYQIEKLDGEISNERVKMNADKKPCVFVDENKHRWVLLPIQFKKSWESYKAMESIFWTVADYRLAGMKATINRIFNKREITFFEKVAARGSCMIFGDTHQKENAPCIHLDVSQMTCAILELLQVPEARAFFGYAAAFDNMIFEMWSLLSLALANDDEVMALKCVEDVSVDPLAVRHAQLWVRHVEDSGASVAERIMSYGLLLASNVLNITIILAIISEREKLNDKGSELEGAKRSLVEMSGQLCRHVEYCHLVLSSLSNKVCVDTLSRITKTIFENENKFVVGILADAELSKEDKFDPFVTAGDLSLFVSSVSNWVQSYFHMALEDGPSQDIAVCRATLGKIKYPGFKSKGRDTKDQKRDKTIGELCISGSNKKTFNEHADF